MRVVAVAEVVVAHREQGLGDSSDYCGIPFGEEFSVGLLESGNCGLDQDPQHLIGYEYE